MPKDGSDDLSIRAGWRGSLTMTNHLALSKDFVRSLSITMKSHLMSFDRQCHIFCVLNLCQMARPENPRDWTNRVVRAFDLIMCHSDFDVEQLIRIFALAYLRKLGGTAKSMVSLSWSSVHLRTAFLTSLFRQSVFDLPDFREMSSYTFSPHL
jgi:hypothetical protein